MNNDETFDFLKNILPALAIPIVLVAWIIHTVSNRLVDYLRGDRDVKQI